MDLTHIELEVLDWVKEEPGIRITDIVNRNSSFKKSELRNAIWSLMECELIDINDKFTLYAK